MVLHFCRPFKPFIKITHEVMQLLLEVTRRWCHQTLQEECLWCGWVKHGTGGQTNIPAHYKMIISSAYTWTHTSSCQEEEHVIPHFLKGHGFNGVSWPNSPGVASHKQAGQSIYIHTYTHRTQVCSMKEGVWTAASPFWNRGIPTTICSPHTQNNAGKIHHIPRQSQNADTTVTAG